MRHNDQIQLRNGVKVSRLSLGTATFGGLFTSVSDEQCNQTLRRAIDLGINFIDTAPHYGKGTSERRIGGALTNLDRSKIIISTKVGRLLVPSTSDVDESFLDADNSVERVFDFSADGVRHSLRESLERLGIESVDILFIHDADDNADAAILQAYPELEKMRDEGIITSIGVGMNQCDIPVRLILETDIDMVLIAGRYSLLDQRAASELLPLALERNVDIVVAGVFNSGILANPVKGSTFDYMPASDDLISRAVMIRELLDSHGISITAAAMQFPFQHPAVKSVLVGCRSADEVERNIEEFNKEIPNKVWEDLVTLS